MDIDIQAVLSEMQQRFPKELEICVQAVQIRMLQEQIAPEQGQSGNEETV